MQSSPVPPLRHRSAVRQCHGGQAAHLVRVSGVGWPCGSWQVWQLIGRVVRVDRLRALDLVRRIRCRYGNLRRPPRPAPAASRVVMACMRVIPFAVLDMVGHRSMALAAITRVHAHRNLCLAAARSNVLAPRPVAVLALDIGHVLQRIRDRIPVAVLHDCGRCPTELRHHVIESAIDSGWIGVESDGVTSPARARVCRAVHAIDIVLKHRSVHGFGPRRHRIRSDAAAVAGGAGLDSPYKCRR